MIALLIGLAGASELAPYAQIEVDTSGLHVAVAATSVLSPELYLFTGLTWQDGLDPLASQTGVGRPHADVGLVAELGALHVLTAVGAGWDGWESAPFVMGRQHAVVELPPLPLLIENRFQIEASLGQRVDVENRSMVLYRMHPVALGVQVEPAWTSNADPRTPLGARANIEAGPATLGLFAGWDIAQGQPAARFTGVVPF
ncbi:MAG: hypothetical protein KC912_14875 [Proteobacteria bacterium]|nr:hypothetical protein [Pseudomonadota bacterium]